MYCLVYCRCSLSAYTSQVFVETDCTAFPADLPIAFGLTVNSNNLIFQK